MVEQAEKEPHIGNGGSANGVAEAVDVDVLIRAPVLVLNLNYVPVNVCTVRRAIVLLTKGKAELLENHAGQLHTVSRLIDAPSVTVVLHGQKAIFASQALEERSVLAR